jgi:NAD(P)-dependent dehydrogenase (short-subunit alcohol dehydrogenase family)
MSRPVAVVTGAGSGIGRRVTHALLEYGYSVALAGRRADALDQTLAESDATPDATLAVPTDVSDPASVDALFERVLETFGRVDLLFNNAGSFGRPAPFEDYSREDWRTLVDVNLTGAFLCAQRAYRAMLEQDPRGGRIVNNGSISAHVPRPHAVARAARTTSPAARSTSATPRPR